MKLQSVAIMDDTRIFAKNAHDLSRIAFLFETFQKPYGQRTGWGKKSDVTFIGAPLKERPKFVIIKSTSGPKVVTVVNDHYIARTEVDNVAKRYQACAAIVENCFIPALDTQKLPLSAVLKVIEARIISPIRGKLALQPLKQSDAEKLDSAITDRVRQYFHWAYPVAGKTLSIPLEKHGFGLTSTATINRELLLEGLRRDLNHHQIPYRTLAEITLADLTCGYNGCRNPLESGSLVFGPKSHAFKHFPRAWTEAVKVLNDTNVSCFQTDQSFISTGDVGLKHLLWSREPKGTVKDALKSLETEGILTLKQLSVSDVEVLQGESLGWDSPHSKHNDESVRLQIP